MTERYFVETRIDSDRAILVGGEAHHLTRVMRHRQGDRVALFDGSGTEFTAEVCQARRDEVELKIIARDEVDRELTFRLSLAVALPKGDRQRWLVEKAVELGVAKIIPLRTARSVAEPGSGAQSRMARWVIGASKQCGRNRLMEIAQPMDWTELLATSDDVAMRWFAQPGGRDLVCETHEKLVGGEVLAAIGPEGGFTDEEVAAARDAHWHAIGLGPRILRVETAAVYVAALMAANQPLVVPPLDGNTNPKTEPRA